MLTFQHLIRYAFCITVTCLGVLCSVQAQVTVRTNYSQNSLLDNEASFSSSPVTVLPTFPGGEEALDDFVSRTIRYPRTGRGGYVYLSFVVDTDGAILNPHVVLDIGGGCGREALRIVKLMPHWQPGKTQGKPVPMKYTMPIYFDIEKNHLSHTEYWEPQKDMLFTAPSPSDCSTPQLLQEVDTWRVFSW